MSKRVGAKWIAITALFVALIAVGGFIRIPIGAVPMTLQTLMVLLTSGIGGKRVGFLSVLIYLLLGLLGVPLFSVGGGITYLLYPTFGYLFAFLPATLIAGVKKGSIKKRIALNLVAVLVIHVIGVSYFYLSGNLFLKFADELFKNVQGNPVYTGAELSLWQAFLTGSLVFIPLDVVSAVVGAIIGEKVSKIVNK